MGKPPSLLKGQMGMKNEIPLRREKKANNTAQRILPHKLSAPLRIWIKLTNNGAFPVRKYSMKVRTTEWIFAHTIHHSEKFDRIPLKIKSYG